MAYEILKTIVEAEAEALEKKRKAAEAGEQLKAQAQMDAADLLEQTRKKGLQMVDDAVVHAVEDSVATIQGIRREANDACEEIRKMAAKKKEDAIQAVIGKVVGTYGSN